ncbi:MAG: polysaccharide biosynthesis tyrosine autokinase [Bryobacteraceae bacterium]|jgi:capsular exopolysaccharide synthesis family protein
MEQLTESLSHRKSVVPVTYTEVPYAAPPDLSPEPEEAGLFEYLGMLRRRKGTLLLIASIGLLIGFVVTIPQTRIYQAKTSVEILGLNQNFLNSKQTNPVNDDGSSADGVDIQTQVKVLESGSLLDAVLAKLQTDRPQTAKPSRAANWRTFLNLGNSEPSDAGDGPLDYAKKHYKVRASGQTRVIEISVDSMDPQIATRFANTMTDEFIYQNIESRYKASERTGEFLSHQLGDMRVRLERSEDVLQKYARLAGLLFISDEKNNVSEAKLMQVQQALSAAQTDRISKQSRWEMANSSPPEALPDILNDPALRDYQVKLTDLQRQLAELGQTYTADHVKVKRVQAEIATLQSSAERERGNILKQIKNEYAEAARREQLLTANYASQRAVVTGEGDKSIQYNILKREVDSNRQLYDAMLQQLKEASVASALRASNIRVLDPAKLPIRPYSPNVPISSGFGLLCGLLAGAVVAIRFERSDRSIQEPGETPMYLNVPELGVIPSEVFSRVRVRVLLDKSNGAGEPAGSGPVPVPAQRVELVTWQRKPSPAAQSFRSTLVSILFSGENGTRPHVIVVTSGSPAEGKSTVISNLAIAVAEANQKVLLIDADLPRARLHEVFNLKNDRGLSDLLRSKDPHDVLPDGIIQQTAIPDLYLLTSGPGTSAATSLLYSNRMPDLLRKLRAEFDTIFVDTPPMLQIPDARVLGRMADRVILVIRAGKTTRDAARAAYQRFSEDGTKVMGTILNDWNSKRSPNGYYGYSNGYYTKGYYGKERV